MPHSRIEKKDVSRFWNDHPLGSYEAAFDADLDDFYEYLDRKKSVASQFSHRLQEWERCRNKRVLELGCGPGWNVKNYAENGACIAACDITRNGARLAKKWLEKLNLPGEIVVGDVEQAPYKSGWFDFVLCDGVLHHTPGIAQGLAEIHRTVKPGGKGLISVYYQNIFLRRPLFWITKLILRVLGVRFLGGKPIHTGMSLEEFGRLYDGCDNVLGKIYSRREITRLVESAGLKIVATELHYFPTPFLPGGRFIPDRLSYLLGRLCGTMIYLKVTR